jgi:hypothetical protein
VRFAGAGIEHRHWRFIGVQHAMRQQLGPHRVDERLQLHAAAANPLGQRRPRDGEAGTAEDRFLPVQRQVIGELAHKHLREQARGRQPLVDDVRRHWSLHQLLALGAGPLAANVALHREHAGLVIELLGHVLADALHLAAATAYSALRLVADLAAREIGRQRLALWLLALAGGLILDFFDLVGDRLQVRIERFFQQAALPAGEALGLGGELQALEDPRSRA